MTDSTTHKACTRCARIKPVTAFAIKGILPTGKTKRRGYCKACYNAARRRARTAPPNPTKEPK